MASSSFTIANSLRAIDFVYKSLVVNRVGGEVGSLRSLKYGP